MSGVLLFFGELLTTLDKLLGSYPILGIRIFVDESIAFIFGILITLQAFGFHAILCEFILASHQQDSKILAQRRIREVLQGILCRNDTREIIALAIAVAITEICS